MRWCCCGILVLGFVWNLLLLLRCDFVSRQKQKTIPIQDVSSPPSIPVSDLGVGHATFHFTLGGASLVPEVGAMLGLSQNILNEVSLFDRQADRSCDSHDLVEVFIVAVGERGPEDVISHVPRALRWVILADLAPGL